MTMRAVIIAILIAIGLFNLAVAYFGWFAADDEQHKAPLGDGGYWP